MRRNLTRWGLGLSIICLAACESVVGVGPGSYSPNESFNVSLGKKWTAYPEESRTRMRSLTIDGLTLNQLAFVGAIKDGQAIVYTPHGDREMLVPTYRKDMGAFEIAEFVTDSLTSVGMVDLEVANLRPAQFDTLEGLRFEFSGSSQYGLNYSGTVKAAVEKETLHLILYYAPTEYYFSLHEDEIDRIMESVTLN